MVHSDTHILSTLVQLNMYDHIDISITPMPLADIDEPHSLANLPDGVITIICEFLMVADPIMFVVSVPNICRSWREVCLNQVSLKLYSGWSEVSYLYIDNTFTLIQKATIRK